MITKEVKIDKYRWERERERERERRKINNVILNEKYMYGKYYG